MDLNKDTLVEIASFNPGYVMEFHSDTTDHYTVGAIGKITNADTLYAGYVRVEVDGSEWWYRPDQLKVLYSI